MTYVINNRIPKFLVKTHYTLRLEYQKALDDSFQTWLKERVISNLARRKICSQLYDFSAWLLHKRVFIEEVDSEMYSQWCRQRAVDPRIDFGDFLAYARGRLGDLEWQALP